MALRWKKHARETGLRAVVAGPRGSDLRDGETVLATVYASRRQHTVTGWYWVSRASGDHVNTCNALDPDEATAKAQAMAHVKQHYKATK
jgi:hypothetical protein